MESSKDAPNANQSSDKSLPIESDGTLFRSFIPLSDIARTATNSSGQPDIDHALLTARLQSAIEKSLGPILKGKKEKGAPPSTKRSALPTPKDGETWSTPENGKYYYIKNIGNSKAQWLDVVDANTEDGAQVVAWHRSSPITTNQIWRITKAEDNSYTIQNACALVKNGKIQTDEVEKGSLKLTEVADDKKLVHGSGAFKWKIEPAGESQVIFRLKPFNDAENSGFVLSTINDQTQNHDTASPQLREEISSDNAGKKKQLFEKQLWAFIEIPVFVLQDQKWL